MLNIEMGNTLMHSLVRARTLAQRSGFCNVNICTGVMWTSAHQTAGIILLIGKEIRMHRMKARAVEIAFLVHTTPSLSLK